MSISQNVDRRGVSVISELDKFGPLAELAGKWVGTGNGWNVIAVPDANKTFNLEVHQFNETINVRMGATTVPNKGGPAGLQVTRALEYDLSVTQVGTGAGLHIENGMWLMIDDSGTPDSTETPIVRQSIVPHGNSVLLLGKAFIDAGPPKISKINTLPLDLKHQQITAAGYIQQYRDIAKRSVRKNGFPDVLNPNQTLVDALEGQTVTNTITLDVSTDNDGGIASIPFIDKHADVVSFASTFWIETVTDSQGSQKQQLQYSQLTLILFDNVFWPHVDVNTLVKQ
ncbi:MAG: hypothetical protein KDJ97_39115 [Anaerolineae bacterium]|nr:hypothetical protein [Anaerolineae bacterium]